MRFFNTLILSIFFISCKNENNIVSTKNIKSNQNTDSHIILGEDIEEINAYPLNIYKLKGIIYIELDLVKIEYKNIDEKIIVNNNSKIRTYIIDKNTLIYSSDCKTLNPEEFFQKKKTILKNNSTIAVGNSKNGKMISINFGCYG